MTPEQQQELNQHIQAIAKILHQEAEAEKIQTLEGIETTIREQTLKYITPKLGFFFCHKNDRNSSRETEKNKKHHRRIMPDRKTSNPFKYSS